MAKATRGVGKDDLISNVAGITELTKENAKKVINAVLEGILTILEQSRKLRLVNFGTFSIKQTKERQGINPKTQEPITIPASYRMGFKVSKRWKEKMLARKQEQTREKVKVHTHKDAPKAKAAAKPVVKKPLAKGKGKKK
jgi:DNA-binding protein HU-beta